MDIELIKEKVVSLVIRGKEKGTLSVNEIYEVLPTDLLTQKEIFMIFKNFKMLGIKIQKPDNELKQDLDGIKLANMVSNMLTKENSGNDINDLSVLSGYIEIREKNFWIKHIYKGESLKNYLLNIKQNTIVNMEIDGFTCKWAKMKDGRDGRKTSGIKPIGKSKEFWVRLQERRGELVAIKLIDEE